MNILEIHTPYIINMACPERTKFYLEYAEFKYIVKIPSVIKGRHNSLEKDTLDQEFLEVYPEPENKKDKQAFEIHPVIPVNSTYGHVPRLLNVALYNTCNFAEEVNVAYEIWCKPIASSRDSKPSRWMTGGGLEQDCIYWVYCGALLYEKLMMELELLEASCEVEFY